MPALLASPDVPCCGGQRQRGAEPTWQVHGGYFDFSSESGDKDAEKAKEATTDQVLQLRLYIASGALASAQARANLAEICSLHSHVPLQVEVVDILREPLRALSEGILVTPTLARLQPPPVLRIVGDLSDRAAVINALGLTAASPS